MEIVHMSKKVLFFFLKECIKVRFCFYFDKPVVFTPGPCVHGVLCFFFNLQTGHFPEGLL